MVTGTPARVFTREIQSERLKVRDTILDSGSHQKDAFTVDQVESLRQYEATAGGERREELLAREVDWLTANNTDVVVSDIVPLAFVASLRAGVPSVAVSNFSWDFIYSEYLTTAGSQFRKLVWQIADDYACATKLLRLPGYVPMPAFKEIVDVPMVVRPARRTREEIRRDFLGASSPGAQKMVVFIYGGQPPGTDWKLEESCLPEDWVCVVCAGGGEFQLFSKRHGSRFILAPPDAYTPDLIAAADCVLGKIGYGTTSECLAHSTPLIFLRRDYFNEEPFLRKLLEVHDAAVEMKRRDFVSGNWAPYLRRALELRPKYSASTDGAATVAQLIQSTALVLPDLERPFLMLQGKERLRDTIAWGYALGRPGDAVDVPEWYARGGLPTDTSTDLSQTVATPKPDGSVTFNVAGFEVLSGPELLESDFSDTLQFVSVLDELAKAQRQVTTLSNHELRAAAGLFDWSKPLMVTRAPGRLDVMGGIADYSGSTVLQLPLAEAAHVAIQLQPAETQRLWQHQAARGEQGVPALRVVSMNAEATNRGHAFDVSLTHLTSHTSEGERWIISYEQAQIYFKKDPALSWAAYVVGALVVLMHEKGLVCEDGIAMLVSSNVPEGKGVSSSAAIEVASMQALATAHDIHLDGRELALLCQKVENLIVGAPCGVMDQMASALGEAGSLMALCCQPAEVERPVHIPQHIRFWGIDSGIRHSVGGSDYGAVRTGAFMGLKILTMANIKASSHVSKSILKEQAIGNGYLANIAPSRYLQQMKNHLPQTITGSEFLDKYGHHWDDITHIDPQKTYAVETPTSHPIHENFRVLAFRQTLAARGTCRSNQLEVLGELMLQSHASYSNCGLGSQGTDRLVDLVMEEKARAIEMHKEPALYGAKITGGGCGGTVCVIGRADDEGEAAVQRVVQRYAEETGHVAQIFAGSSGGVIKFGALRLSRQPF